MATNNLQIKISAKNRTTRAFRAVKAGLGGIARAAFSMRTAIGLAAGAAGLGYLVKKSMDATDNLAKTSRAIGVSTAELQKLRHAASLGGLETTALDKAMQKLAINIADVAGGTGEAKDAFEKYGIKATNADGTTRGVTDVLGDAADALKGMTNATDRASFVYDLFGARGAKVINMLKDGKGAMEAMKNEASALGLVMDESLIEGVEEANDAITRLTAYLKAVFMRVVATLAPYIKDVTDNIREWIELKFSSNGGIIGVANSVAQAFKDVYEWSVEAAKSIGNMFQRFQAWGNALDARNLIMLRKEAKATVSEMNELFDVIQNGGRLDVIGTGNINKVGVGEDWEELKTKLFLLNVQIDNVQKRLAEPMTLGPIISVKTGAITTNENDPLEERAAVEKAAKDAAIQSEKDRMAKIYRMNYGLYGHLDELEKKSIASNAAANEQKMRQAYSLYGLYRTVGEKTQTIWEETADSIKDAYQAMSDSISGTLTDLLVDGGNWGDAMKSIINEVYREFVRKQISAPLVSAGGDFMNDFFKGMFSPAPITGVRAMGGPVGANKSFLVGESGPEIFTPSSNGHITANVGESQPVNITYNIKSWDSRDTMTTLQLNAPQIVGIIQEAFQKRGQRGFA